MTKALDDFKSRWNAHRIRPSRTAGCPSGVPDDLYSLPQLKGELTFCCAYKDELLSFSLYVETSSYIKSLDTEVWACCYQLHVCEPNALYPAEFTVAADAILARDFGIGIDDVTIDNVQLLYLHLVNEMSD